MGPVFLFGTGRCGSTHLQRIISLNTDIWVWGEHDGFLNPLLRGLSAYETSAALKQAVFDVPLPRSDERLVELVRAEGRLLSWLNRLEHDSLRRELRLTIARLFSRDIPAGWTGWGFKEILYGGPDDVPAILLDMFPACRAVFTFRAPAATLDSMIRAWTPDLLAPGNQPALAATYDARARRWCEVMRYFITLKRAQPDGLTLLDLTMLALPPRQLLRMLRLPPRDHAPLLAPLPATNRGPDQRPGGSAQAMAALFDPWREEMGALYDAALGLCVPPPRN